MRRLLAALLAGALLVPVAGADAKAKRPPVVCFKKAVKVKGKKVRRKVCRARRSTEPKAKAKVPEPLAPAPVAAAAPAAIEPAASAPLSLEGDVAPMPAPVCADPSPWVGATAEDVGGAFRWTLTRQCVRAGRVLVSAQNRDLQPHDLWAKAAGAAPRAILTAAAESGEQGEVQLTAGAWTLYCSIPGHESMARALTVTPAS